MNYKLFPLFFVLLLMSFTNLPNNENSKKNSIVVEAKSVSKNVSIYNQLDANSFALPSFESFTLALDGFYILKEKGLIKKNILTLVDFSLSSNTKRMWVIDLEKNTILFQTLVAHGRNTGEEFAKEFSNRAESYQSSIGFYATAEIYNGKHGKSLKLDGLEKGLNDKARERAVVVHGADYVSESFIKQNKRLGRSQGCPAVPYELHKELIETIKGKSCIFIYHPSRTYVAKSKLVS